VGFDETLDIDAPVENTAINPDVRATTPFRTITLQFPG
jgi:hypothetical protein